MSFADNKKTIIRYKSVICTEDTNGRLLEVRDRSNGQILYPINHRLDCPQQKIHRIIDYPQQKIHRIIDFDNVAFIDSDNVAFIDSDNFADSDNIITGTEYTTPAESPPKYHIE